MLRLDVPNTSPLSILEIIADPIWIFDLDRHAIYWGNAAALTFWHASSLDDLRKIDFSSDSAAVGQRLQQVASSSDVNQGQQETWTLYPAGKPVAVTLRVQPVAIEQGRVGVVIEVTDNRGAHVNMQTARMDEAVRYSGVILSMYSLSGLLLFQNSEAFECYGNAQGDTNELHRRWADRAAVTELFNAIARSDVFEAEVEVATQSETTTHHVKAHVGRDPVSGETVAVISENDISNVVRLRSDLAKLNANLETRVAERSNELRISEERFSLAMLGANDGLWDHSFETGETYVSPRWRGMLGYDDDPPPDTATTLSLVAPEDRAPVEALLLNPDPTVTTAREIEFRIRHKDGHWVDILARAFLVVKDAKAVRIVGTTIDITDRKQNERKLKRLMEILVEGSQALPLGVAFYDADLKLVMNNQSYADMLPISGPSLARGTHFSKILENSAARMAAERGYSSPESYIKDRLQLARTASHSWTHEQTGGRIIVTTEIPTSSNGVISLIEDVTEEKTRQKQLQQAQKIEAIGQLTGGIAHDFNNLLAVIMGNLELLQIEVDMLLAPEQVEEINDLVDAALKAVKHGADLTNNMLAYARKAPLTPTILDLNKTISEIERWIRRTIASNIQIETVLQGGVWPVLIDQSSFQSALVNLILNARDAMEGGGKLTIETANLRIDETYMEAREETVPRGRYVMVAVSDTGPGISPDVIDLIYDPFFTTKEVGKGTGLGLSMVEGFVKQSKGMIRVYSEPGIGTSFKLFFNAQLPDEMLTESSLGLLETAKDLDHRRPHILIAEDQPEVLDILRKILLKKGYNVSSASTGDSAFSIFKSDSSFDLVVTDIVMPGRLQGPALAKECRQLRPETPFIFLSGYASEATVHGNGLRPEDIRLMKPVSRSALLKAVENCLSFVK